MSDLSPENLAETFYRQMQTIRRVEETLLKLFSQGKIRGTVHTCLGQEATAAGVINALDRERDVIFSNHRAHGHFIAYSDDVTSLIAEVAGKPSGVCGGIGGTQHLHQRNFYTNGIQGGIAPVATGSAAAEKKRGSGAITVVFLGDGTMGEGIVYESFNIAALWQLPILFVVDNNQYAQSTPVTRAQAGRLQDRAAPFGIESGVVDAEAYDVFAVFEAARRAVDYVRNHSAPYYLLLNSYRLGPHSKGDDFRAESEIARHWQKDPLTQLAGQLPPRQREAIDEAIENRLAAILAAIFETPAPLRSGA
jgi:TPP-dependent pyruvate/acetoin dehydrogenase alpha subunit